MSFCPIPHTTRDQVWLAVGAGLGAGIAMLACSSTRKDAAAAIARPQIMLFGDSITQQAFNPNSAGWGAALANWYARQADVLSRGFSGYNTRQALPLLKRLLPRGCARPPALLTIFFGANDAADAALNPAQHVPLDDYQANLSDMVAHVQVACPGTRIVLVTPPPVVGEQWAEASKAFGRPEGPPDRTREVVAKYAEAVRVVGAAARLAVGGAVVVVDLWQAGNAIEPEDLADGLHFGASGNTKMFGVLQACIKENFGEDLNADDGPGGKPLMPIQFPYWAVATPGNISVWTWAAAKAASTGVAPTSAGDAARAKAERG